MLLCCCYIRPIRPSRPATLASGRPAASIICGRVIQRIFLEIVFTVFLIIGSQAPAVAQQPNFTAATRLTQEEGLPTNRTRAVDEDPFGFMWIATRRGLSRFDGTEFKNYFHDPADAYSLPTDWTSDVLADSQYLWITTGLGFSRYDYQSGRFYNYQISNGHILDSITDGPQYACGPLYQTRNGDIWIGSERQGLVRYLAAHDTFYTYQYDLSEVSDYFSDPTGVHEILSLDQDRIHDSILWAGTLSGVIRLNMQTNDMQWYQFPHPETSTYIAQNAITRLYAHDDGKLYCGSWAAGINVIDTDDMSMSPLPIRNQDPDELFRIQSINRSATIDILRQGPDRLWISSLQGLMSYHTSQERSLRIWETDLVKERFYAVRYIDRRQRVWNASAYGLFIYDPILQQFGTFSFAEGNKAGAGYTFYFVYPSPFGQFAVFARDVDAIYQVDMLKGEHLSIPVPQRYYDFRSFIPRGAAIGPNGKWIITTRKHIIEYSPEDHRFRDIVPPSYLRDALYTNILWDRQQRLWIGTFYSGIIRWSPQDDTWENFRSELKPAGPAPTLTRISHLLEDSRGNIWINSEQGFSVYHAERDTFYNFLEGLCPPERHIHAMRFVEDPGGRVWISGKDGVLAYAESAHPERGVIQRFDMKARFGLPNTELMKVDGKGRIWGIYDDHLYRFHPDSLTFTAFDHKYGISQSEFFGFDILPTGELLIGGRNAVWMTHPDQLQLNPELPRPYLSGISVLEEPLETEVEIPYLSALRLKHWENFFSFDFSAIGFTLGDKTQFRYRLIGFDENWIEAGQRRYANYTNVPAGDYVFEVQAANNEGRWNEAGITLPVSIATAWYLSWWFLGLLGLSIVGLVYGIYRYRITQTVTAERLKASFEKRLLEVEMNALRAQMNPHFLFNCLNSIERYIIINDTRKASEYLNNFARLIRLILQNSRSNYIPLSDEIEALGLYLEMESMRFRGKFSYDIIIADELNPGQIDIPPMLLQPYVENAIWHGLMHKKDQDDRRVRIELFRQNGYLIGSIEDNGIGRARAQEIQQQRPAKGRKSVGMRITGDRIRMINQLYHADTSVAIEDLYREDGSPRGTKVTIRIPI